MKTWKKLPALLLAMAAVLGLTLTALAAEATGEKSVQLDACTINGSVYVRLEDAAQAAGFSYTYDAADNTVTINPETASSAADAGKAGLTRNADGSINVPQDGSQYVPKAGDVICCDDGTNYTITDVKRWDGNMFASGPVIGVSPADEYQFRIFCTPVGPYFKGGAKPITIRVSDFDRAAPHGTGHIKAGLNYAMSLHAIVDAHKQGYDENMYLDAATRTKVEETGGANFIFVTKDNKVVTPKSPSILPSITRRSLMHVAKEYLGLETEEREVHREELKDFAECGLCGTAAVISPIGYVYDKETGREWKFSDEPGKHCMEMYNKLQDIQHGRCDDPYGWTVIVE